jgi:RimJ/RimL family protein N-acetyltransferase
MIRLLQESDYVAYFDLVDRSRDGLQMFPWVETFDIKTAQEYVSDKTSTDIKNTTKLYGLFIQDILVGCIEVRDYNVKLNGHELGYFMDSTNRGRGHMKIALQEIMKLHKDENPFYADVLEDNAPSLWMLWGLGFKEDHRWRRDANSATFVRLVYNKHLT